MTIYGSTEVETAVAARSLLAPEQWNALHKTDFSVNFFVTRLMSTICPRKIVYVKIK